jgi:hypothetical protein
MIRDLRCDGCSWYLEMMPHPKQENETEGYCLAVPPRVTYVREGDADPAWPGRTFHSPRPRTASWLRCEKHSDKTVC